MIIALLTGRGTSGSLPEKNIYPVLGRPLMVYPLLAARKAKLIDDIYISTDGEKLKAIAREYDVKVIDRPPEYARADSEHDECLIHAVQVLKSQGIQVDILVVLLCNVGIHPDGKIDECIQALLDNPDLDAAVTVREWGDHHPTRAKTINAEGLLEPILPLTDNVTTTRQKLSRCYYLDHQVWALRVNNCLKDDGQPPWKFMGKRILGIPNHDLVIDVHTLADIAYTEMWLRAHGFKDFSKNK